VKREAKRGIKMNKKITVFLLLINIAFCSLACVPASREEVANVVNRGVEYFKQGQDNKAIAEYNKAIRLNPNFAEPYFNRGAIYASRGNYHQAIADNSRAIALNPNIALAYANRATSYAHIGKYEQALSDINRSIELGLNDAEVYCDRGVIYGEYKEYVQAICDFNLSINLSPNNAKAYYNRGVAYFKRGNFDPAWEDVHKAEALGYEINPNFLKDLKKASGREK
jgi:tetratricopeptide (TPR) repeat protein